MICPNCGKEANQGAKFCANCGINLPGEKESGGAAAWSWEPTRKPEAEKAETDWKEKQFSGGTTYCRRCDKPIPLGDTHCAQCADIINRGAPRPAVQRSSPRETVYAGFWMRFFATLLDAFILGIPLLILFSFFIDFGEISRARQAGLPADVPLGTKIFGQVLSWLLVAGFESSTMQGTPGKAILGLKVTDTDGNRIDFLRATLRYICELPSMYISLLYLVVAFTERKQGIHDFVAGTLVVRSR